jgi:VWFA-related protein
MTRFPACLSLLLLSLASSAGAQTPAMPTLKANTKIVVIDVVVTDKLGNPVKNLQVSDFALTENSAQQTISHFDAHTSLSAEDAAKVEAMPKLAPNIFTNYSPVPVDSSLNVLLIDDLNTQIYSKTVVIQQALKYLSTPHPGARMEIFELVPEGAGLKLIQGFTSDPEVLRVALTNRKVVPQSSVAVDDPMRACGMADVSQNAPSEGGMLSKDADAGSTSGGAAECMAMLLQRRSISTLEALAALARYMGGLPGRKNLLWFSSSFPMPVNKRDVQDQLHKTMSLFAKSQVAVYPIVAGGLMKAPDPLPPGARGSQELQNQIGFYAKTDNEQATMERMAEDTGGKVFAKTNDLAGAADKAVNDGSNYYTLTYTPENRDWKGEFRKVQVKLAEKGYTLAYRPGYYADDVDKTDRKDAVATAETAPPDPARIALNSAMEYGSPQPSDVVLKVAVNPATGQPESAVAKLNVMSPKVSAPFERYVLSVAALPTAFTFTRDVPGKIHMAARLVTRVYSADGTLINKTTLNAIGDIDDARYQTIMANGVQFKQEISVPVKGESFLRIGVEDLATNRIGVVEIPVAMVAKLKPLAAETVPQK